LNKRIFSGIAGIAGLTHYALFSVPKMQAFFSNRHGHEIDHVHGQGAIKLQELRHITHCGFAVPANADFSAMGHQAQQSAQKRIKSIDLPVRQ